MARGRKGADGFYDALLLPNAGAKTQTPASLNVDLHYAKLKIYERWDWNRYVRLAAFLKLTPHELGSIACLTHRQIDGFQQSNRLKQGGAKDRAGAMVLTLIEAHVTKAYSNDVVENPFPDLTKSAPSAATS